MTTTSAPSPRPKKRAIVLIHGIGEQIPMQTLRGFVDAVWTSNAAVIADARQPDGETGDIPRVRNPVWSKPDDRTHSFELNRITTERGDDGVRTDFFEYYWAHLMHGSTWDQVTAWIGKILLRSPKRVPRQVYGVWFTLWALVLTVIAGIAFATWCAGWMASTLWLASVAAVAAIGWQILKMIWPSLQRLLINYVGDIVRYVEPLPPNIARRQEIREQGVSLLERLMGVNPIAVRANAARIRRGETPVWDSDYDQIIIVGHSLGTMVGYDILKHAFARVNTLVGLADDKPALAALEAYCQAGRNGSAQFETTEYRRRQAAAAQELTSQGSPWTVSDFVTLGSPLTHAEFLMAWDKADLREQQVTRNLPTCPPALEWQKDTGDDRLSYPSPLRDRTVTPTGTNAHRVPHHAAHFGFTRWTNIYSPHSWIIIGDLVSGQVAELFGLSSKKAGVGPLTGAEDIALTPEPGHFRRWLTHTLYWSMRGARRRIADESKVPRHIAALRQALGL